jgi:hypothetical protein
MKNYWPLDFIGICLYFIFAKIYECSHWVCTYEGCLCVASWLLSRSTKVIYTTCIVNNLPSFLQSFFWAFKALLECKHGYLIFNSRVQHLTFEVNGQHIWAMHQDLETMMPTFIIKDVFVVMKSLVNIQMQR